MKKNIKYLILILLITFTCTISVEAKTLADLKSELSSLQSRYEENKNKKRLTQEEIKKVKQTIISITNQIDSSQVKINELNDDIDKRNIEIGEMNEEIKSIVHYYQLSSSASMYLEYVFNAKDFTDFIYRLAVTEQLSEYRKKLIGEYQALIEKNKQTISELQAKQKELTSLQNKLTTEYDKLGTDLAEIVGFEEDLEGEIATLKKNISLYESKYKCSANEDLSDCVNRYNRSQSAHVTAYGSLPSAAGFYRPLKSGRITQNFGDKNSIVSFPHRGIDIGTPSGSAVYPIANGTVVAISLPNFTKGTGICGGRKIYIAHSVNGRTYTSGYYHLSAVNVSVGQQVTYNTVIASSGGTESWDYCSGGAHLHLQIAGGIYMLDYSSGYEGRAINPRALVDFPALGSSFSSR